MADMSSFVKRIDERAAMRAILRQLFMVALPGPCTSTECVPICFPRLLSAPKITKPAQR
jgi:hypothetical protein